MQTAGYDFSLLGVVEKALNPTWSKFVGPRARLGDGGFVIRRLEPIGEGGGDARGECSRTNLLGLVCGLRPCLVVLALQDREARPSRGE